MSQKKNRKPLTDTLAQQFVYGENPKDTTSDASQEPTPTQPKEATVRFTVDLPLSMHRKLSLYAARTGKKKAEIVRVLLDETLKDLEGD